MLQQVYGWHGTPARGTDHQSMWVHVPDETYLNTYPRNERDGKPYHGQVHVDVEVIKTTLAMTRVTKDGETERITMATYMKCLECGAEQ